MDRLRIFITNDALVAFRGRNCKQQNISGLRALYFEGLSVK